MKFLRIFSVGIIIFGALLSCKKEMEKQWDTQIEKPVDKVEIVDISKEFYNPNLPLEAFQKQFPWFQGTVTNEDFVKRRQDSAEAKIYHEAIAKIDIKKLDTDLKKLYARVHQYFPDFKTPRTYLYSSALQAVTDPIFYKPEENFIFVDVTAFMGENNPRYKGLEQYYQTSMNPQNIVPKISQILAESKVPFNRDHQKFLDQLAYQGKIMTLQDAFLPETPDYLKINYTQKQYEWAVANEVNIWNYLVEQNLLYSDDSRLVDRFIAPGPFSKFYTEIDNESTPQIGIFTGWQICKKYFQVNPDTPLQKFLDTNAQEIFTQAKYKPKFTE